MQELENLLKLANKKHQIDIKRDLPKYLDPIWALDEIINEVSEVKDEIKENNLPYLEDELGDILWGWIIAVEKLKAKGLVRGHKEIIQRALKKYDERINSLIGKMPNDSLIWKNIKAKQKEELENEKNNLKK